MRRLRAPLDLAAWAVPAGVTVLMFGLYWWTLAPSISELHDNVDGAELVVVADVLGVAHPPGSAIWLPLGKASLGALSFIDEPARRTNLLSAVCGALAAGLLALAAVRWRSETPPWAAALAGVLAGTGPIAWSQAIVTEVMALQSLLTALALVLAVDAVRGRRWPAFALVLGLLAWNHPTGLALAVPLGLAVLVRHRPPRRTLVRSLACFAAPGLFSVSYLLLRADAPIAWGDTGTLGGVWDHLRGKVYDQAIDRSPANLLSAIPETLRRTLRQVPPPAWLLAPVGALALIRVRPAFAIALGVTCGLLVVFVSTYLSTGRQDYLATVAFVLALLGAWGADEAWRSLRARFDRGARLGVAILMVGLVAVWVVVNGDNVDRRGDTALRDEAIARLEAAPPGAVIQTSGDFDTFPLWYARNALGVRPDVTLENTDGLAPTIGPD